MNPVLAEPNQNSADEMFLATVERRPNADAVRSFGRTWTYSALAADIAKVAQTLVDAELTRGDRIVVQQQNGPQFLLTALAAWSIGVSVVPISPMYRAAEVRKIALDSGAKAWLMTPRIWDEQGAETVADTEIQTLIVARTSEFTDGVPESIALAEDGVGPSGAIHLATELARRSATGWERPALGSTPDLEAVLAYTSGSTGRPRGVVITHANLLGVGSAYAEASGVDQEEEVLLALAPLVHITGLSLHIGAWLATGCTLVLADRFEPRTFLEVIERERVTWTTGTATAYLAMMKVGAQDFDLTSWQYAGCGGAPIPPQLAAEVEAALGVQLGPGYGLTESTAAVTTTRLGDPVRVDEATGIVSVGPALPGMQVRTVGENGEVLAPHQEGVIQVHGPGRAKEYWQDAEASKTTFLEDGWLQTSDVGFVDEDGWLYISGRQSQVIIASGYKVWPRQVEDVLYSHPGVLEAAVVGAPDAYRGETVVAYVALKHDVAAAELREHCKELLAAYKVPREIHVLPELPKNSNGKINYLDLKERVA